MGFLTNNFSCHDDYRYDVYHYDDKMSELQLLCSAQLASAPLDVLPAEDGAEFITLAEQSLVFWRLNFDLNDPSAPSLQFQQSQRPAWLSTSHHFTCACFVPAHNPTGQALLPTPNRVLVGTSKGVVLVYDFDENILLQEIAVVGDVAQSPLRMLGCPSWPMVVAGLDTGLRKLRINQATGRCETVVATVEEVMDDRT